MQTNTMQAAVICMFVMILYIHVKTFSSCHFDMDHIYSIKHLFQSLMLFSIPLIFE